MTISSTTSRISYTGNAATTAFSVPFRFDATSDLVVYLRSTAGVMTLQTYGTDYTLSGTGVDAGGTCTFTTAPGSGVTVIIYRDPALTQTADYSDNSAFPAATHEAALDKVVMINQRTRDLVTRAVRLPDGDTAIDMSLPAKETRASKFLAFDANGQPTASAGTATGASVSTTMQPVVEAATLATALVDLGLTAYTTGGTSTAYTVTTTQNFASLSALNGQSILVKLHTTSGVAPTINVDGLGAKAFNQSTGVAVPTGAILSGSTVRLTYINASTEFILDGQVAAWAGKKTFTSTDSIAIANGTTAQRSGSPAAGDLRFNSTLKVGELYDGNSFASLMPPSIPQGRLTLTTGTPVLTATVSGATTVYYTPHLGQLVPIYNGASMVMTDTGGELSQATTDSTKSPAAVGASSLYDVFVWNDSGTIRATRGPAWSSATTRGTGAGTTELQRIQGFWTNKVAITNGPAANKGTYVGTIASNGSSTIDFIFGASAAGGTAASLQVWNMYNRVPVATTISDSGNYNYSTATIRAANGSNTMRATYVCGQSEDVVSATYITNAKNGAAATSTFMTSGIGIDSTSAYSGLVGAITAAVTSSPMEIVAAYDGVPGLGQHFLQACEFATAASTTTWNNSGGSNVSGLTVRLRM